MKVTVNKCDNVKLNKVGYHQKEKQKKNKTI